MGKVQAEGRIEELLAHAASRLSEALDEAAADALIAVERYGAKLQTFCKEAAERAGMPDSWNSLRNRAQRLEKARSTGTTRRARAPEHDLRHGMKHAPKSAKAKAVIEALEHDPDVFADQAVLDAAAMAVSAQFTPREPSENTKAARKTTEQIAFLAYLTAVNVDLKGAEKALEKGGDLTEDQRKAAGQQLDRAAESIARLTTKVGSYELETERS
jgi:hypothetical protein